MKVYGWRNGTGKHDEMDKACVLCSPEEDGEEERTCEYGDETGEPPHPDIESGDGDVLGVDDEDERGTVWTDGED